ncbi:unnamed protein product [Adineta ricciae]|uniref:NHL repeat containing protein-like protein n=1 Tax=Adineta ricciae TaxID=249248 RepID=A0A814A3V6_ADIRI|nr:unnamed protein product [Adineta ricciae]
MLPPFSSLLILLIIAKSTQHIARIEYAGAPSTNSTDIMSYESTCLECVCYAFSSSNSSNYRSFNCYTNDKTCVFFADDLSSMLQIDLNSNFFFTKAEPMYIPIWNTTGINVTTAGSALNQTNHPYGLFIPANSDSLYIADSDNDRILKWLPGATSGILLAGGQGKGWNTTQFNSPREVCLDRDENLYVADSGNYRIQRFDYGSFISQSIAGNGSYNAIGNSFGNILGLGVDLYYNVYVSEYNLARVTKWIRNGTSGIRVAGDGTQGNTPSQLNVPTAFYTDPITGTLYIPNQGGHCVTKWLPGSSYGITVAGVCGQSGTNETLLTSPKCVTFDKYEYMYVVDGVGGGRILMFLPNSLVAIPIITNGLNNPIRTEFGRENECSIRLQTDQGIETCQNQQCLHIKDPWRVIGSHIQDQPCYVHYLQLSFTNYDLFLVFIELQYASNTSLDSFFSDNSTVHNLLEIHIDKIYPFNDKYFLTEDTLNKLGGQKGTISLLQIEIFKWYNSRLAKSQTIENELVDWQPFQQIIVRYPCNIRKSIERLVLAKYLAYQERSSCPTQIRVTNGDELIGPRHLPVRRSHLYNSDFDYELQSGEGARVIQYSPVGDQDRVFNSDFIGRLRFDSDDAARPGWMNLAQSGSVDTVQRHSNGQPDRLPSLDFNDEVRADSAQQISIRNSDYPSISDPNRLYNSDYPSISDPNKLYNSDFNDKHRFTSMDPIRTVPDSFNSSNSTFDEQSNDSSTLAKILLILLIFLFAAIFIIYQCCCSRSQPTTTQQ